MLLWHKGHHTCCFLASSFTVAPRSFCAAFMRVPRAQGVGELTSECEVKVPFFSVVTQLPSLCFLSVVFCGVLAAC